MGALRHNRVCVGHAGAALRLTYEPAVANSGSKSCLYLRSLYLSEWRSVLFPVGSLLSVLGSITEDPLRSMR